MVKFAVKSANELQYIAQRMAKCLFPGAFLALNGDLGAGKTTFTQGLAKGLGVEEEISSPTFSNETTFSGALPPRELFSP